MNEKPTYDELKTQIAELKRQNEFLQMKLTSINEMRAEELNITKEKVEENENKIQISTIPDLIWFKDINGVYTQCNKRFEELYGFPEKDIIGKTDYDFVNKNLADFFREKDKLAIEIGKPSLNEEELTFAKDGHTELVETIKTPIYNKDGQVLGVLGIARDISKRKQTELTIKNQNEELKKRHIDKDILITILAHDLKNPFNSILGFLDLLANNIRQYDINKIEDYLEIINISAKTTFNLLEDILIWVRANSGKIPFEPQKMNFASICNEVSEYLKLTANAKDITINNFSTDEINIFADRNMVSTVLRNLVSNSIKFTHKNGQIDIYAEKKNTNVLITVSDNGIGIEPETLTKLFDITQKITTYGTAKESGTGFGLLLCKEFVEKHGGKIWVESILGKGSDLKFTMPIVKDL